MVFPISVKGRHFITDSGGAGRQRGGAGAFVEFGPADGCRLEVGYVSNGAVNPANGARGGGPGAPARQYRRAHNGELEAAREVFRVALDAAGRVDEAAIRRLRAAARAEDEPRVQDPAE